MSSEQLLSEIKTMSKTYNRAKQTLAARSDAINELKRKWAIATAEEHGVVIGQKRFIKPRNSIGRVDYIYYSDWSYPELDIRRIAICFDYSHVDPVPLSLVVQDSEVVGEASQ